MSPAQEVWALREPTSGVLYARGFATENDAQLVADQWAARQWRQHPQHAADSMPDPEWLASNRYQPVKVTAALDV